MRLCFFEDELVPDLEPLTLARPACELLCGRFTLRERLVRNWNIREWGALIRPYLAATYREQHPEAAINNHAWLADDRTLLVNATWLPRDVRSFDCDRGEAVFCRDTPVALWLEPDEAGQLGSQSPAALIAELATRRRRIDWPGTLLRRPWDLVDYNADQLWFDFEPSPTTPRELPPQVEILGDPSRLALAPGVEIEPFVVIDTRPGPVTLEPGALVRAFTRLEGPCAIGRGTQLFRAQVTAGTTIGPVCRVGGEVENSILHGWSNKYHDGFLGHSYVCPWVNIGAQSGTSDLKFDYSQVRVPLTGDLIETNLTKVGSFIGDHTKTAVNSLFDTGTAIGVMSLVLPDGDLIPRHVPSFSRYWRGRLSEGWELDRLFDIARTAMSRRGSEFTSAQEMLFRVLFDRTRVARDRVLSRSSEPADGDGGFRRRAG